ncbi:MAG: hypothetical protein KKD18_04635 [Nanoarchaeota archaeon]|nr:hypothetical protein [Nanoarchaeota archaeon]MBU0977677.1 hypothetical protein [Nanoarchaeota archaeon]
MVFKTISQAIEDTVFVEAESLWMEHVVSELDEGDFQAIGEMPREILEEMRKFVERNSLVIIAYRIDGRKPLHCCCSRCLKAHLIKKCKERGFGEQGKVISRMFNCETGHNGYYIDDSELFEV